MKRKYLFPLVAVGSASASVALARLVLGNASLCYATAIDLAVLFAAFVFPLLAAIFTLLTLGTWLVSGRPKRRTIKVVGSVVVGLVTGLALFVFAFASLLYTCSA